MKFEDVPLHKIEMYLAGRLPPDETTALEQKATADPELAQAIEFVRLERDGMELILEQNLRADMTAWEKERATPVRPEMKAKVTNFRFRSWLLNVAAVMLIAAAISFLWWKADPELINSIWQTRDTAPAQDDPEAPNNTALTPALSLDSQNVAIARAAYDIQIYPLSPNINKTPLELADSLYMVQKYLEAAKVLTGILYDEQAPYKRGHAYFMAGEYKRAAADFETVVKEAKGNLADAKWYWALSLLAHREAGDATVRQLLNEIARDENSARCDKANEILAKIQPR